MPAPPDAKPETPTPSKPAPADPNLIAMLKRHEGVRLKPYRDTVGKLTIGVGRNLDDVGLAGDEVDILLLHDIERATTTAREIVPGFDSLSAGRKNAAIDLAFNLGNRLAEFKKFLSAVQSSDWDRAASELLDSVWAVQVGPSRSGEITGLIRRG